MTANPPSQSIVPLDDFDRPVFGLLGIPLDAVDMAETLACIRAMAKRGEPYLVSTPNMDFLAGIQADPEFHESLLQSDLCLADGAPIVWLARMLGIPLPGRVAGSDLFEALKQRSGDSPPLRVFIFGGGEGVADAACRALNSTAGGMTCVGTHDPGFVGVDDMSGGGVIETINASGADFLVAALGARKGQAFLLRNHDRIRTPVRSHLGATVNFQAGHVARAPLGLRRSGLEWLWRIKEEPSLWRRYARDLQVLLKLIVTKVVPFKFLSGWYRIKRGRDRAFAVNLVHDSRNSTIHIDGDAVVGNIAEVTACFRSIMSQSGNVIIDLSRTCLIDHRFLGSLIVLRKQLKRQDRMLELTNLSSQAHRLFRHAGFTFLLGESAGRAR